MLPRRLVIVMSVSPTHTLSLSLSLSLCPLPLSRLASAKEAVSVKLNEKRFSCCCVFPSVVALALIEILRKANTAAPRWAPLSLIASTMMTMRKIIKNVVCMFLIKKREAEKHTQT